MTKEECFAIWAPDGVAWSAWAKPSLFARMDQLALADPLAAPPRPIDMSWVPAPRGDTALIVELPGAEAITVGMALAEQGYRPVPLYNASVGPSAVIEVEPIARALQTNAEDLRRIRLADDAPPAFLIDADRMRPTVPLAPGKFDNRWIVFPQDFPSAIYLLTRGTREVWLLRRGDPTPGEDLAHVLLRWRQGGLRIMGVDIIGTQREHELDVREPSLFRKAWYRAMALAGLRRNNAGGFGAIIPVPSSGG